MQKTNVRRSSFFRPVLLSLFLMLAVLLGCSTPPRAAPPSRISRKISALAHEAVFEVVVRKPALPAGIRYEQPPDFSALPYAVRIDEYAPVGTAFAVSPNEAVTAFHVLNPASKSAVHDVFYIRKHPPEEGGGGGKVYEIDTITRASNEMDFVFFTIKDMEFPLYFETTNQFTEGEAVYSIGSAWGEGVIIRGGAVLGSAPEAVSGRWRNIKTSAPGNPGNSGGPLVNAKGKAVGIITFSRDTIFYAAPFEAVDQFPESTLQYALDFEYGHLLLPNRIKRPFTAEFALPLSVRETRDKIAAQYFLEYQTAMTELFSAAPDYPRGKKTAYLTGMAPDTLFPQIDFVDGADGEWKLANFEVTQRRLKGGKTLLAAEAGAFNLYRIIEPEKDGGAPPDIKKIVDTLLEAVRVEQTETRHYPNSAALPAQSGIGGGGGGNKNRILSLGEPAVSGEYRDALGRLWLKASFLLPFDDFAFIVFVLPTPGGPALLTAFCPSAAVPVFEFDMKKTLDHTHIAYSGSFQNWETFLKKEKWTPLFLRDFVFDWKRAAKTVSLSLPALTARLDEQVFQWTDDSELFMSPAWQPEDGGGDTAFISWCLTVQARGGEGGS